LNIILKWKNKRGIVLIKKVLVGLLILGVSGQVNAGYYEPEAKKVLKDCEIGSSKCYSFLTGVLDMHNLYLWKEPKFCLPKLTNLGDMRETYIRYMRMSAHRYDKRLPAAAGILKALEYKYPCETK